LNGGTPEIKALAVQSPIEGLLHGAERYLNTNPPSSNGCNPTRYVVLVTDGLPTQDVNGLSWPPLGSVSASAPPNGYGVSATFNPDGSLAATNDQALTDTINRLNIMRARGIKTYVIGLGAGVDPTVNPVAAQTLTAMAVFFG
jgi:type IV pilus assembly protein PilY1